MHYSRCATVAARPGVCGATVDHRLVVDGQLAHVRVLNAIRVAPVTWSVRRGAPPRVPRRARL